MHRHIVDDDVIDYSSGAKKKNIKLLRTRTLNTEMACSITRRVALCHTSNKKKMELQKKILFRKPLPQRDPIFLIYNSAMFQQSTYKVVAPVSDTLRELHKNPENLKLCE